MPFTQPLVLPHDVTLVPVATLAPELRAKLKAAEGDFALARPGSRTNAKLIDATTAAILRRFAEPTTIVDALLGVGEDLGTDPEALLEAAFPTLRRFIREGILLSPLAAESAGNLPTLAAGDTFAGMTIRASIYVRSDTELYLVTTAEGEDAVLKVTRPGADRPFGDFPREARALARLAGSVAPRLFASGRDEDRNWMCMQWQPGVSAYVAASEMRRSTAAGARKALAACCCAVADAYADLHARGVVHGDVHDANVIIDREGRAWIVDFGFARLDGSDERAARGGVASFYEAEFARAVADGTPSPPASTQGEQYAVAVLVFGMFTGQHYLALDVKQERAMRQIARRAPRRFADCGVPSWPAVEAVLRRALSKDSAKRFASMKTFAEALRAAAAKEPRTPRPAHDAAARRRRELVQHILRSLEADARLANDPVVEPPTASVAFGAAGIAFALHRIAMLDGDPARHALADLWSARAEAERRRDRAFLDDDSLRRGAFGRDSMNYGAAGVDVVAALVASARGDLSQLHRSAARLARLPRDAGDALDFVLGVPSALLGIALVADSVPPEYDVPAGLLPAGHRCAAVVHKALERRTMVHGPRMHRNLGIAHGWGGALYTLMRWHRQCGTAPSPLVRRRLDALAALGEPHRRGMRWPWRDVSGPAQEADAYMPGWCNGSAGFVHLWLMAHETYGDPAYRRLAEAAAWDSWDDQESGVYDLCCGRAGRAYAMLALHRATRDDEWLARARFLTNEALDRFDQLGATSVSLYKGGMGPVLLYREMERHASARMPLFEREA